jgi:hypothetical protein
MALFIATLGVGCSSTSSAGLATSSIQSHFHVDLTMDPKFPDMSITADLYEGSSLTSVQLAAGDTLTVTSDKDPNIPLQWDSTIKLYSADLKNQGSDWTKVTFALTRANGAPAPSSTISLPLAIALTSTTPKPTASYAGGSGSLALAWSNTLPGATVVYFNQPCGSTSVGITSATKPDDGTLAVPVSELVSSVPPADGTCVTMIVRRVVKGTTDPAYAGGSDFDGYRDDYFDVTIMP